MASGLLDAGRQPDRTLSLNMKLVAHHELSGHGGIGEPSPRKDIDVRTGAWLGT